LFELKEQFFSKIIIKNVNENKRERERERERGKERDGSFVRIGRRKLKQTIE
jgi:hypothetical protein